MKAKRDAQTDGKQQPGPRATHATATSPPTSPSRVIGKSSTITAPFTPAAVVPTLPVTHYVTVELVDSALRDFEAIDMDALALSSSGAAPMVPSSRPEPGQTAVSSQTRTLGLRASPTLALDQVQPAVMAEAVFPTSDTGTADREFTDAAVTQTPLVVELEHGMSADDSESPLVIIASRDGQHARYSFPKRLCQSSDTDACSSVQGPAPVTDDHTATKSGAVAPVLADPTAVLIRVTSMVDLSPPHSQSTQLSTELTPAQAEGQSPSSPPGNVTKRSFASTPSRRVGRPRSHTATATTTSPIPRQLPPASGLFPLRQLPPAISVMGTEPEPGTVALGEFLPPSQHPVHHIEAVIETHDRVAPSSQPDSPHAGGQQLPPTATSPAKPTGTASVLSTPVSMRPTSAGTRSFAALKASGGGKAGAGSLSPRSQKSAGAAASAASQPWRIQHQREVGKAGCAIISVVGMTEAETLAQALPEAGAATGNRAASGDPV